MWVLPDWQALPLPGDLFALIFVSLIEGYSMSQLRLAHLCLMLAAVGFNAAPVLMTSAHAQKAPAEPAAAASKPDTVRPELFKLLDPAQLKPLMDAKNYPEVQNRLTQADALAGLTPYETFVINRTRIALGSSSGNEAMAIAGLEAVLASGRLQPEEQGDFVMALATYRYNAKDYPKAIELLKRYQKESKTPEKATASLIRAYYLSGDFASAKTTLAPMIAETEQAGKVPSEEDLRLLGSAALKLKDQAAYLAAIEKLAAHYPTDDLWADMINRGVIEKPGFDAQNNSIEVFRLQLATVKSISANEYTSLAESAMAAGFPTEAKKVLDAGFAAGTLGTGGNAAKHRQLRDKANKGAADDAKNIAAGEASASKSKNGAGLVNLGWAYVTMDQFDKGIGFIQQGIAKGGMKRPDEAKLRLGMAYAKAGRKAEAIQAFETVKAGGGLSDLARYWVMAMKRPDGTAAAPATAAK
jgi:tetratricopeptide (TPR) repeat protein